MANFYGIPRSPVEVMTASEMSAEIDQLEAKVVDGTITPKLAERLHKLRGALKRINSIATGKAWHI